MGVLLENAVRRDQLFAAASPLPWMTRCLCTEVEEGSSRRSDRSLDLFVPFGKNTLLCR